MDNEYIIDDRWHVISAKIINPMTDEEFEAFLKRIEEDETYIPSLIEKYLPIYG